MAKTQKGLAKKAIDSSVVSWSDGDWTVVFGKLAPGPGRPHLVKPIFRVLGEKLPKAALNRVESMLESKQLDSEGVYFAHDSLGCARYAGRGKVFDRLRKHFKAHPRELLYFSF